MADAGLGRKDDPDTTMAVQAPARTLELDTISSHWQLALDAGERALYAAAESLPADELSHRRTRLVEERLEAARSLTRLARIEVVHPAPWLSPVPIDNGMLGLQATVVACLFDLDGVLTDSGVLHAWAWGEVLDQFLLRVSERAGWHFIPFDRTADYREYIDGRPRLEGIHAFLGSRGIRLPEGDPDDPPEADTAYGLAAQKAAMLSRGLRKRGSTALGRRAPLPPGCGPRGARGARSSPRASTPPGCWSSRGSPPSSRRASTPTSSTRRSSRSRPAPDLLRSACRALDVQPHEAVTFTQSVAGVAAGRAAGLAVIGIGEGDEAERLRASGAEQVFPSLRVLLDRRLTENC